MSDEMIASLRNWWALAGVDRHYANEPVSLLAPSMPGKPAQPLVQEPPSYEADPDTSPIAKPFAASTDYPDTHSAFLSWLSEKENLLESRWANSFVLPHGSLKPEIMVMTALPEAESARTGELFTSRTRGLLTNILRALNCDYEQAHFATLALTRPADGNLTPGDTQLLRQRLEHYCSLVAPKRIILFGETVTRAFFDDNLLVIRKKKQFINHVSSKTEAIATFHPRVLLERPELKAEAWRDLQMLTRINPK